MEHDVYLGITEAAEYMNVSKDTLRNWDKSGDLVPHKTVGGHRKYKLSELQYFLSIPKAKRDFLKQYGERYYLREFDYRIECLSDYISRRASISRDFMEKADEKGYFYRTINEAIDASRKVLKVLNLYEEDEIEKYYKVIKSHYEKGV